MQFGADVAICMGKILYTIEKWQTNVCTNALICSKYSTI